MHKHSRTLACTALAVLLCAPAKADVHIVGPTQMVAGKSQVYWAQAWWQWVLGIPTPHNPNYDTSGRDASVNNGGPVFFLAGSFGGPPYSRTISVPYGKPIFFPVFNSFYVAIDQNGNYDPAPCPSPLTLQCALDQAAGALVSKNMSVQVDDISLKAVQLKRFRQTSTSFFSVSLPANNVLNIPINNYNACCASKPIWVEDGYWIALDHLSLGKHVVHFYAQAGSSIFDITDTLNVVAQ